MIGATEILQTMAAAGGHIEVLRGPTDEYITVCRPERTALLQGLLPRAILEDFLTARLVRQDGPEDDRRVTFFRLTNDGRMQGRLRR
jgi:hypothetical protein